MRSSRWAVLRRLLKMAEVTKTLAQIWGLGAPAVMATSPNKLTPVKNTTNDELLVGVELEIENLGHGFGWYQERTGPFWTVVEDGSLRPRGEAWEFVSRPAPLGLALAEIDHLFKHLKITRKNYTDRCSVHVHTNVQDFTQEQLSSLMLVYPVFEEVMFEFINHFKKEEEQGYCRDSNLYCIPWSACRMNKSMVDKIVTAPDAIRYWQKYTALNLLPIRQQGTVEWRHLHGTCDMEKITIWMNVIGAIMRYCKNQQFKDIIKSIKELNDVSHYQQFFRDVLRDSLPYNEAYRRLMAEGVVNAKYSLMDFEVPKDQKKKKSLLDLAFEAGAPLRNMDDIMDEEDDERRERWRPPPPVQVHRPAQVDVEVAAQMRNEWNAEFQRREEARIAEEQARIQRFVVDNNAAVQAGPAGPVGRWDVFPDVPIRNPAAAQLRPAQPRPAPVVPRPARRR